MFFLIGGIQPRTKILDERPRSCASCGQLQVHLKRVDNYVSLFFIPLIRVKRGIPFLSCGNCGALYDERGTTLDKPHKGSGGSCRNCGRAVAGDYIYCPYCGKLLG